MRWLVVFLAALALAFPAHAAVHHRGGAGYIASPAFYVSPTGSDGNNGLSYAAPFLTLAKAQTAMQGSATKVTYLEGGTYSLAAPIALTSADNGESWLGYHSQTPTLDGGGTTIKAFAVSGNSNLTIRWITFQNFYENTIYFSGTNSFETVDSNIIVNQAVNLSLGTGWNQAPIFSTGTFTNGTITHNTIITAQGDGIEAVTGNNGTDKISGLNIAYNSVNATCTVVVDCGGIHWNNRAVAYSGAASTNITINNNVIANYGPAATITVEMGIYADDFAQNTSITNNIIYGTGYFTYIIHGGANLTATNNIWDFSASKELGWYQGETLNGYTGPMTDNTFSCNIVYSTHEPSVDVTYLWHASTSPPNPPAVANNLYYDTTGTLPNNDTYVDTNPTVGNPGFTNAAGNNYTFTGGPPAISGCTFVPISIATVGPLPNP